MGIELLTATLAGLIAGAILGYALWARAAARAQAEAALVAAELAAARGRAEMHESVATRLAALEPAYKTTSEELATLRGGTAARDKALSEREAALQAQVETIAKAAIQESQTHFEEIAQTVLKRHRDTANEGLTALLNPVSETLRLYQESLKAVETARIENYGKLGTLLEQVARDQQATVGATNKLETALRSSSKVAGYWGEEQCRNVLEAAGLVEGTDFTAQTSVDGEDGRLRPDFVLRLPGGRTLVIDVKCSFDAFKSAVDAESDVDRLRYLKAHAAAVRVHANGLALKNYEKSVEGAVDFVVMFLAGENFLAAAMQHDLKLMTDFAARSVVLAGPINLIAVARTVAAMRDQARVAKEAAEIAKLGRELYDSLRIMTGNVQEVHKSLDRTVSTWNEFTKQLDNRVIGRARRFEALGATTGLKEIPELVVIERTPLLPNDTDLRFVPGAASLAAAPELKLAASSAQAA